MKGEKVFSKFNRANKKELKTTKGNLSQATD